MLAEIKSSPILSGVRGGLPGDTAALVDSLLRLARLVTDFPQIAELDINPLAVWPEGVLALDARAVLIS